MNSRKTNRESNSGIGGGLLVKALDGESPVSTEFHRLYSRLVRLETERKLSVLLVTSARRE